MTVIYLSILELKQTHPFSFWCIIIMILFLIFLYIGYRAYFKKRTKRVKSLNLTTSQSRIEKYNQMIISEEIQKKQLQENIKEKSKKLKTEEEKVLTGLIEEPHIVYSKKQIIVEKTKPITHTTKPEKVLPDEEPSIVYSEEKIIAKKTDPIIHATEHKIELPVEISSIIYIEKKIIVEKSIPITNRTKSTEKLPEAFVETKIDSNELLFVNYTTNLKENIGDYPIFRKPENGCIIRTHRIGSSKRRGYKEESFQKSIEKHFSERFTISGNLRLNTGKDTRPYEPDISIIDEKTAKNIRIDIEIDEPYSAITRQATHCTGEDLMRDNYFSERGWIVIRFSEYQIHTQEAECLSYISKVIHSINDDYTIPNNLKAVEQIQPEKQWDIVQAQKWEKVKYREYYLNHAFQELKEQTETINRDFNNHEIEEEKLVKSSSIGKVDGSKLIGFNERNMHKRDNRIRFYPESHIYTIDNVTAPSVSTIISKFFPEFDSVYWSERKAPDLNMLPFEVDAMWKEKGKEARDKGTYLHKQIENYYLKQDYTETEEFFQFKQFVSDHSTIDPYRSEWRIFDEQYNIAGTTDLLTKNGSGFDIYDWKRSKKVVSAFNGSPITENQWQKGIGQLNHIADTSFKRYCLQQSLYKYILEKNYGLTINKMYLIVMHPNYNKYYKVEAPYLKAETEHILKTL